MEIEIREALKRSDLIFIDVRTPAEYAEASIPGAINVPLFEDREHHQLGIIYHQLGEIEARMAALNMVAPKLSALVDKVVQICTCNKPLLYCSRGGMRSLSLYHILGLAGIQTLRLKKGYKAYRSYVIERLVDYKLQCKLYVIHGLTGVGKTAILQDLDQKGIPVIDLEGLANHRGSVFGTIGLNNNRSQKDFDALLLQQLDRHKEQPYLFIEGEGRRIGNIYLPLFLAEAMEKGYQILLTASMETRVQRIVSTYIPVSMSEELLEQFKHALSSLRKRLGDKKTDHLMRMLENGDYYNVSKILCSDYYDLFYNDSRPECAKFDSIIDAENLKYATEQIMKLAYNGLIRKYN